MDYLNELLHNYVLASAGISWICAQIIKTIIDLLINKELNFERLVGSGGMPSCHSATVCALAVASALEYGLGLGVGIDLWILQLTAKYNWNFGKIADATKVPELSGTPRIIEVCVGLTF